MLPPLTLCSLVYLLSGSRKPLFTGTFRALPAQGTVYQPCGHTGRQSSARRYPRYHPADIQLTGRTPQLRKKRQSGRAVTNALASVLNRHRDRQASVAILRAIVIAAKLIMKADNREDAINGLSWLCGLAPDVIQKELHNLQFELNLVEGDESLCCFDILCDAIPKTQFINFLHQRRLNEYDAYRQARLFASGIDKLTDKLTADIEIAFGELRAIQTREWRFSYPQKTHINFIGPVLNETLAIWLRRTGYDEAKENLVFCYAGHDIALEEAMNQLRKELITALKQQDLQSAPVFIILLHDVDNQLSTILADMTSCKISAKRKKTNLQILFHRELQQKSKRADQEWHEFSKLENKVEEQLETAERKERADLYLYSTANFGKLLSKIEVAPECCHRNMPQNLNSVLDKCAKTSRRYFPTGLNPLPPERTPWMRFPPSRNRWKNSGTSFSQFILKMKRTKCERIPDLPAERATALYTWLHTEPAYLTERDSAALMQLRHELHAHLTQQKMDWLLQEFRKLPREQQKALFDRLRLLVNSAPTAAACCQAAFSMQKQRTKAE